MQNRATRQDQIGLHLGMLRDTLPSGANLTSVALDRIESDLPRRQKTKRIGISFADATTRAGPCGARAYHRRQ